MRAHLIFGFLGSGKTTLAKNLLAQMDPAVKTAIIVNEFGEVGVDGEILKGQNVDVVELNSGCLCCTLRGSLLMAVEELRDKSGVECVIVEATGIAQPAELLDSLAHAQNSNSIEVGPLVTVVDVARMLKLQDMLGDFYLEQIETADILIANKIDLIQSEALTLAARRLRELNPESQLVFAQRGEVPLEVIKGKGHSDWVQQTINHWRDHHGSEPDLAHKMQGPDHEHTHEHSHSHAHDHDHDHDHDHVQADHHHGHQHDQPAVSFVVHCGVNGSLKDWQEFFQRLPDNVWRVKGFVQVDGKPTLAQYTMGQLELSEASQVAGSELVFIGVDMDQPALESAVAYLSR